MQAVFTRFAVTGIACRLSTAQSPASLNETNQKNTALEEEAKQNRERPGIIELIGTTPCTDSLSCVKVSVRLRAYEKSMRRKISIQSEKSNEPACKKSTSQILCILMA